MRWKKEKDSTEIGKKKMSEVKIKISESLNLTVYYVIQYE